MHGAFRGATVLVAFADEDAASGRVVAVTDWEEAMVADPAVDLAELYSQASPAAWGTVLDAYTLARAQRPDPYLHARARLVAETRRLRGLARAVEEDDEPTTRRVVEALRRMDRLTEDEDSLVPVTARAAGAPVDPARAAHPQAPGSRPEPAPSTAAPLLDQPVPAGDATTEVPVHEAVAAPGAWAATTETIAAGAAEDPGRGATQEAGATRGPAAPAAAGGSSPDAAGQPTDESHDAAGESAPGENPADDLALLDDEDRLHELYGMPARDEADSGR